MLDLEVVKTQLHSAQNAEDEKRIRGPDIP
jgi:hypothetical protein